MKHLDLVAIRVRCAAASRPQLATLLAEAFAGISRLQHRVDFLQRRGTALEADRKEKTK